MKDHIKKVNMRKTNEKKPKKKGKKHVKRVLYTYFYQLVVIRSSTTRKYSRPICVVLCVSLFYLVFGHTHTQKPPTTTTTTVAHNSIPALNFDSKRFAYTAHRINLDYGIGQWSTNHWGIV